MSFLDAEWIKLRDAIEYHDDFYFNKNSPVISDEVYDLLKQRFLWLSHQLGIETNKVGATSYSRLPRINHSDKMLSIDSAVGQEVIVRFLSGLEKKHDIYPIVAQDKIDGVALSVRYCKNLVYAATRGDGLVGEDVTVNASSMVPGAIDSDLDVCVRGEVFIPKSLFKDKGGNFVSARNAASGILRKIRPSTDELSMLRFLAYDVVGLPGDYVERMKIVEAWGFDVIKMKLCGSLEEAVEYYLRPRRDSLEYEIDGLVFKINKQSVCDELGATARAPRWCVACKFQSRESVSRVTNVVFQVGRSGKVTPVAQVEPVVIFDVTVTSVSLHNAKLLLDQDIHIGDSVVVTRACDVIPHIASILYELRPDDATRVKLPDSCPECDEPLVMDGPFLRCTNSWKCIGQAVLRLERALKAIGVDFFSEKRLRQLYEQGLVTSISDLYNLQETAITGLDGWGAKLYRKIRDALPKEISLHSAIFALGIEGVGAVMAERLAGHFGIWEAFKCATSEQLIEIGGVASEISENIVQFLEQEQEWVADLSRNIKFTSLRKKSQTWCITGKFPIERKELMRTLNERGVLCVSDVSKNVSHLLCGESPGSKLARAQTLGVKIITYEEIELALDNGGC